MADSIPDVSTTPVSPGKSYRLGPDEGTAIWFTNALVTIKTGGSNTNQRLTVAQILHPGGYSPPRHRHLVEDESFFILSGTAIFHSDDDQFNVGPGDFAFLPKGSIHTFIAGPDEPFHCLVITVPAGFEHFVAEAGVQAGRRELPDPAPVDGAALAEIAARHQIEILGPPLSA